MNRATRRIRGFSTRVQGIALSKPVVLFNPITGQQSYTKHPEKLIERRRVRIEAEQLRIVAERETIAFLLNPLYWNGARSHYVNGKDMAMFPPGCNVLFPKIGTSRAVQRYCHEQQY
jgi:hypothetical protein